MNAKEIQNVDAYIAQFSNPAKERLLQMRELILACAPKASEVISYQMPALRLHGMLVYYAAFKNHCSLFPSNSKLIASLEKDLAKYKTSKGTIQFPYDQPLPVKLIQKIVRLRVKENLEKAKLKVSKSKK